jgi:hypothetical protein
MKPTLAVSIYVRSSIKFLHFVPFHQQIWPPRAILVSDWLLPRRIISRACRSWQAEHVFSLHSTYISYSFWNKGWKVLTFSKFDEKRAITSRWVIRIRLGVIALFSSFFSSPDPKGHVRYCHHLASVIRPLTFSYFNLLLWNNLGEDFFKQ